MSRLEYYELRLDERSEDSIIKKSEFFFAFLYFCVCLHDCSHARRREGYAVGSLTSGYVVNGMLM